MGPTFQATVLAFALWGISGGRFHRGIILVQLEGIMEMSPRVEPSNPFQDALAALLTQGLDGAGEALRILVNEASEIERSQYLNAAPH